MRSSLVNRYSWMLSSDKSPLSIAHRGASDYAHENSRRAFELAAELDADMWEVDIRTTQDGVCICHHDSDLGISCGLERDISEVTWSEISALETHAGDKLLRLEDLIELARRCEAGLYIDAKDAAAVSHSIVILQQNKIVNAIVAAGDIDTLHVLAKNDCPYPLAVMVPPFADPFELARLSGADIIHLCWEHASSSPQDLVTPELTDKARYEGLAIVLWHEERQAIIQDLLQLPVLGICSNRPEMLKPYRPEVQAPIAILSHRGALTVAPENTLIAFECGFGQGFEYAEFDIRTSMDNSLMLLHDATVDRTTKGQGRLADKTRAELQALDAGSWFNPFFKGVVIPTLEEFLAMAASAKAQLFVELKSADPEAVLTAVRSHGLFERAFFWSFDSASLRAIQTLAPDAAIMTRRKDYPSLETAMKEFHASVIEFDATNVDESELQQCHHRGLKTMIAYTGDQEQVFTELIRLCPTIVNLDYPHKFKKIYHDVFTLSKQRKNTVLGITASGKVGS